LEQLFLELVQLAASIGFTTTRSVAGSLPQSCASRDRGCVSSCCPRFSLRVKILDTMVNIVLWVVDKNVARIANVDIRIDNTSIIFSQTELQPLKDQVLD
jgi:hypothetical protein